MMAEDSASRHRGTVDTVTPGRELAQIAALLADPGRITPAMLRIKIRAVCEGCVVPSDRQAFLALAERAGVPKAVRYRAWTGEFGTQAEPALAAVTPLHQPEKADQPVPLAAPGVSVRTALYRYYDEDDLLLYIGISDLLSGRVSDHIDRSTWMEFAARSTITRYSSRADAAAAEAAAVQAEHPLFNYVYNSTPEARRRLVEYLIKKDRLDLLAPAVSRG